MPPEPTTPSHKTTVVWAQATERQSYVIAAVLWAIFIGVLVVAYVTGGFDGC